MATPEMINGVRIFDFMKIRRFAGLVSILLILGSFISLGVKGINWGLDFTGGTLVELRYDQPADTAEIREQLKAAGYSDAVVQEFGSARDILVRIPGDEPTLGDKVARLLDEAYTGSVETKRVEFVGPQVGERLREQGGLGMLMALAVVMVYIAFRFQFKFSVGSVAALAHDSIIVLGAFSLFQLQFDLTVLAAILAVIGYSLNDTIIVYDRVRENFRKVRDTNPEEIINISLSQTLGRTLATSGTTLFVLLSLYIFGGEMIHGFSTALLIGIGVGTYSSIYIASNLLLVQNISRDDLIVPVKEGDVDEMP